MQGMKRLIFVRHGETEKNVIGKMHQVGDDSSLTPLGVQQVQAVIPILQESQPEIIFTSTEKRAHDTAELLSYSLGVPIEIVAGIQERDWGDWSGFSWPQVEEQLKSMSLEERFAFVPPNGESWQQGEDRLRKILSELVQKPYSSMIIVTHVGTLRMWIPVLLKSPREKSLKYDFDNTSISIFDYDENESTLKPILVNDTAHLKYSSD